MKKRTIIYIACAVAITLIIAFTLYFVITSNKSANSENEEKITVTKYNEKSEIEKTIEITNKKQMQEINKICENLSLEQDDTTPYLWIKEDIELDLGNGKTFIIQLDLAEYCLYEDTTSNIKLVIKMPNGLLEKINEILK